MLQRVGVRGKLRVLHVNCVQDSAKRTGDELLDAWPTLVDVAGAVRDAGAEVTVLQSAHRACTTERSGVAFRFVAEPGTGRPGRPGFAPWHLVRAARQWDPDVIHVNGLGFPAHIRALSGLNRPVFVQDHADTPRRGVRGAFQRWGLAKIAAVSFTSADQAEPFFESGVLGGGTPVFAIPESSSRFTPGDRDLARKLAGVSGEPALLWVGRLNDNKDPLTVLDALSLTKCALPN